MHFGGLIHHCFHFSTSFSSSSLSFPRLELLGIICPVMGRRHLESKEVAAGGISLTHRHWGLLDVPLHCIQRDRLENTKSYIKQLRHQEIFLKISIYYPMLVNPTVFFFHISLTEERSHIISIFRWITE